MTDQLWLLIGTSLFSGLGASAVAFVGYQIHEDLSGHLRRVERNEERSQTNRQALVRLIRNAEGDLTIDPERLAEDLDPDHD